MLSRTQNLHTKSYVISIQCASKSRQQIINNTFWLPIHLKTSKSDEERRGNYTKIWSSPIHFELGGCPRPCRNPLKAQVCPRTWVSSGSVQNTERLFHRAPQKKVGHPHPGPSPAGPQGPAGSPPAASGSKFHEKDTPGPRPAAAVTARDLRPPGPESSPPLAAVSGGREKPGPAGPRPSDRDYWHRATPATAAVPTTNPATATPAGRPGPHLLGGWRRGGQEPPGSVSGRHRISKDPPFSPRHRRPLRPAPAAPAPAAPPGRRAPPRRRSPYAPPRATPPPKPDCFRTGTGPAQPPAPRREPQHRTPALPRVPPDPTAPLQRSAQLTSASSHDETRRGSISRDGRVTGTAVSASPGRSAGPPGSPPCRRERSQRGQACTVPVGGSCQRFAAPPPPPSRRQGRARTPFFVLPPPLSRPSRSPGGRSSSSSSTAVTDASLRDRRRRSCPPHAAADPRPLRYRARRPQRPRWSRRVCSKSRAPRHSPAASHNTAPHRPGNGRRTAPPRASGPAPGRPRRPWGPLLARCRGCRRVGVGACVSPFARPRRSRLSAAPRFYPRGRALPARALLATWLRRAAASLVCWRRGSMVGGSPLRVRGTAAARRRWRPRWGRTWRSWWIPAALTRTWRASECQRRPPHGEARRGDTGERPLLLRLVVTGLLGDCRVRRFLPNGRASLYKKKKDRKISRHDSVILKFIFVSNDGFLCAGGILSQTRRRFPCVCPPPLRPGLPTCRQREIDTSYSLFSFTAVGSYGYFGSQALGFELLIVQWII